jgi:arabinofuranan 3-O-arabinosyltransferase
VGRKKSLHRSSPIRFAELIVCAGLVVISFIQDPGRIASDTKLDIAINPTFFLKNSLHLWDPLQAFGSIPYQAYGYFFPMGPFFMLGHILTIPPWVSQRIWLSAILVAAFMGLTKLASQLNIGTNRSRLLAGVVYALAPCVVSLGAVTAYILPIAALPWVMIPLVASSQTSRGESQAAINSPRRSAAMSAVAILFVGATNAAAVVALLPVPVLWFVVNWGSRNLKKLLSWWATSIALVSIWWLIPLELEGKYGFNFLQYTEQPQTTFSNSNVFSILRGTNNWTSSNLLSYPYNRAGWITLSSTVVVLSCIAICAVAMAGLAHRSIPQRVWLLSIFTFGVLIMGSGYSGVFGAPFSHFVQSLFAGPLGPFRNIWKFNAVVSLALCLGFAHALGCIEHLIVTHKIRTLPQGAKYVSLALVTVLSLSVLVGMTCPWWQQVFYPAGATKSIPGMWQQTSQWLTDNSQHDETLLVPGSPTGTYIWGNPLDEPMQWLGGSSWGVRNQMPNSSTGNIAVLDEIDRQLSGGRNSATLVSLLQGLGVHYLVARYDINPNSNLYISPSSTFLTLQETPGLREVNGFGPWRKLILSASGKIGANSIDSSRSAAKVHSIEIYSVPNSLPLVKTADLQGIVSVAGNPVSMAELVRTGLTNSFSVPFLAGDAMNSYRPKNVIVTDNAQRVAVAGGGDGQSSYILTQQASNPLGSGPVLNWNPVTTRASQSVAHYTGIRNVFASSYGIWPFAPSNDMQPFYAIDGNPDTYWMANALHNSQGQWIQFEFRRSISIPKLRIKFLSGSRVPRVREISITTASGTSYQVVDPESESVVARPHKGPTTWLRITFVRVAPPSGHTPIDSGAGISEVLIPGISASRWIDTPRVNGQQFTQVSYSFSSSIPQFNLGSPLLSVDQEPHMRRIFFEPVSNIYRIEGSLVERPGRGLLQLQAKYRNQLFSDQPFRLNCGFGPQLLIDNRIYKTEVEGTFRALFNGMTLNFRTCGSVSNTLITAGTHRLEALDQGALKVVGVVMTPIGWNLPIQKVGRSVQIQNWQADQRLLRISSGPSVLLEVDQNFNLGWQASINGQNLHPVRINGWQQGWIIPAGGQAKIELRFVPDSLYHWSLLIGLLCSAAVLLLAVIPKKRRRAEKHPPLNLSPIDSLGGRLVSYVVAVTVLFLVAGSLAFVLVPLIFVSKLNRRTWVLPVVAFASLSATSIVVLWERMSTNAVFNAQFSSPTQIFVAISLAAVLLNFQPGPKVTASVISNQ